MTDQKWEIRGRQEWRILCKFLTQITKLEKRSQMEEVEGELFSGISDVKYEQEILVGSSILVGEGNGNLLQYSCLENCRDGGAWWAAVYGVAQSRTQLKRLSSSSSSSSSYSCLEKIPWTEEPGRLQSIGLLRVGHN